MARMELLTNQPTSASSAGSGPQTSLFQSSDMRASVMDHSELQPAEARRERDLDTHYNPSEVDVLKQLRSSLQQLESTVARWSFMSREVQGLIKTKKAF